MSDDRHATLSEATLLQTEYPVSYAIFAMARAQRAIASGQLAELGLYPNQEIMLVQLAAGDGLSQKMLAQTLRISHAAVAKSVRRLESMGLVERRQSTSDRRVTLVFLSYGGRAVQKDILSLWERLNEMATSALTNADQRAFLEVVAKIRSVLDAESWDLTQPTGLR